MRRSAATQNNAAYRTLHISLRKSVHCTYPFLLRATARSMHTTPRQGRTAASLRRDSLI